ncbi:MAG: discoidin domain-containing protein [Verrucomicrobiia bacterium]
MKPLFKFLALCCAALSCCICYGKPVSIRSGEVWYDTSGNVIQAHGGCIIQVGNRFYWYGEDRETGKHSQAIRCYSSTDLKNWEFRNKVLSEKTFSGITKSNLERPKVLYCEATKRYVMWVHKENNRDYTEARVLVASCDKPDGDFVYHKDFRPMGNMSRDLTLFKDDDGKAYLFSASNDNADLLCYELSADYLDVVRVWTALKGEWREAPAVFKRNGRYYLITSACTGWGPNGNLVTSSTNIYGPYGKQQVLCPDDTWNTYCSQSTFVLPIRGTKETNYIFIADRWKGWNLKDSRYIFLPILFDRNGSILPVQWGDEWTVDVQTGECAFPVKPQPAQNNIAKGCPATASVANRPDGNEARCAVDGDSRSKWCASDGEYPHWLCVDLGEISNISRSEIQWERRDGTIYFYKIESSNDGKNFSTVVDKSSNADSNQIQTDTFSTSARYFRVTVLGSKSPRGGYAWASFFEWSLYENGANKALKKFAFADSEQHGSYAQKANDGLFVSAWQTGSGRPTNWWMVDLGKQHSLTGCRIMWQDPGFLYQYRIEVSSDNLNWQTVVDMTQNKKAEWLPVHSFNATARYVRVSPTGIEDGCWLGIREFELFDTLPLPPGSIAIRERR